LDIMLVFCVVKGVVDSLVNMDFVNVIGTYVVIRLSAFLAAATRAQCFLRRFIDKPQAIPLELFK
ncbi:unnamed protein product, partial [Rotaria sp. Silwood2]